MSRLEGNHLLGVLNLFADVLVSELHVCRKTDEQVALEARYLIVRWLSIWNTRVIASGM